MKIGIIGDTHLGSIDYSRKRRADFSAAFVNAIRLCRDNVAEAICLLGDVFDSAATRRNVDSFAEIVKEISPALIELKTNGVPLIAIPGNHEYGRGREAGELSTLEHLGFIRVLRAAEFAIRDVAICGVPWQHNPSDVPRLVEDLRRSSRSAHKILLLHNFVKGARSIPSHLWEVDPASCAGFAKIFVGHHHVYEALGDCVMPGSTETQNMLDESEKCVVIYDCESRSVEPHPLPKTHRVLVLDYDISIMPMSELISRIARDLDDNGRCAGAFVYIRVRGTVRAGNTISQAEIQEVLRGRELFDSCIELRYSTEAKTAAESLRGASVDNLLGRTFTGRQLKKAKHYLAYSDGEKLFEDIREAILSDHQKHKSR
jgi:DNA repair exonuclease SbcCD nuclease subunit